MKVRLDPAAYQALSAAIEQARADLLHDLHQPPPLPAVTYVPMVTWSARTGWKRVRPLERQEIEQHLREAWRKDSAK